MNRPKTTDTAGPLLTYVIPPTAEQIRALKMSAEQASAWRRAARLCQETDQESMTRPEQEAFQKAIWELLGDDRNNCDGDAPPGLPVS